MQNLLAALSGLAPCGYAVGLHVRFAVPTHYISTLPDAWQDLYDSHSYRLRDPLVLWGMGSVGQTRWSEVSLPDPFGILRQADRHGLRYGVTVSCGKVTSRSLIGVARNDREFTDAEMAAVAEVAAALHEATRPADDLTPAMVEALRLLGQGHRYAAAAARIGISESALKARLSSARAKLGARTTAEALTRAREHRLI
jgi:LuxR family transcriptional regulator